MKKNIFKRILLFVILISIATGATLYVCNTIVTNTASGRTTFRLNKLPQTKTGLLLGTSKYIPNGRLNLYFKNRIDATIELFKTGKIQFVVISGDNSRKSYDEPTDMKKALIESGIDSTKIYLDYAGFRTFDSVIRLKKIFGQDTAIIISQKFHNERAIYIANNLGINLYGYNAKDVGKYYGFKTAVREKFARVKVILDFVIGMQPKFLGEKIEIR
ncbi:MAG TPA: ElyC/SanA/YdcF family protein [Patescibacteria group bacterium]|nr:ElyC/SanA/YdcF family protein [Patescibacteria group bacterium]